jgi:nicotinamidase-related amidase
MPSRSTPRRPTRPGPAARRPRRAPLDLAPPGPQVALLLVDVINDLDFPGSEELVRQSDALSRRIARLASRARRSRVPVIYVNDNFGQWRSDWRQVIDVCLAESSPGRRMVDRLQPHPEDYFVLKPKHSGFYSTTLDLLLRDLEVGTVVLAGLATDICILFTADDAYMRGYRVVVPADCVAANTRARSAAALRQIRDILKGRTPASRAVRFESLRGAPVRRRAAPR